MPWIFWPASPVLIEENMRRIGNNRYENRNYNCIYVNSTFCEKINYENWLDVVDFHDEKVYNYNSFVFSLAKSRFGLCLKGKSKKNRRVIELMAMTMPIVHKDVNMTVFMTPLKKHYFEINTVKT